MLDFILKYWVTALFGLIAAGMGTLVKKYVTLLKKEKENNQKQAEDNLAHLIKVEINKEHESSYQADEKLYEEVSRLKKDVDNIKTGLLIMYSLSFKPACRKALEKNHELTIEEYEDLTEGHRGYKALGGNHQGDELYNMVQERAKRHFLIE